MTHIHSQPMEQIPLCSIPALQHRHDSVNIPSSHLSTSLVGSAASCLEIGHRIRHSPEFLSANRCVESGLISLTDELYGMYSVFTDIERTWSHTNSRRLWTENATRTVRNVQHVVQEVATSLREIADGSKTWSVVVPDREYYELQRFQIRLQMQQLILNLLVLIMYVLSPIEDPVHTCMCQGKKESASERFSNACQYVASTVLMRREMKEKLMKIDSIEAEYKAIYVSAGPEEMPDVDDWSFTQTTAGTMTPTDDWSDMASEITAIGKDNEDHALEAMLDGFGDEGMRDTLWPAEAFDGRRRDLAKLAFYWTNVEMFAGIKRGDPEPPQQQFYQDLTHLAW